MHQLVTGGGDLASVAAVVLVEDGVRLNYSNSNFRIGITAWQCETVEGI